MSSSFEVRDGLFILRDAITVHAPIERCFKLSCSVELVREELGMTPVGGRTRGLVTGGDIVRWEGWQLGLRHYHVSRISSYEAPVFLQDTMKDGRFKYFQHDHHLQETSDGTFLNDELRFALPLDVLGRLAGRYLLVPHIQKLMKSRFARIKRIAESDDWKKYIPSDDGERSGSPNA